MEQTSEVKKRLGTESAAVHTTTRVPVAAPSQPAGEIRRSLEGKQFETAAAIAVSESGRLLGLISIESLLAAPPGTLAADLMDPDPPVVRHGIDQEVAAWRAVQRQESTLAVTDDDGRFVGLVPPARLLGVLLAEHEEDLARLGGFSHGIASARRASSESVGRRYLHRLPWLLVGLIGALFAAQIMERFEMQLQANVLLAFFVPGIVYMADAVGTQTEALVIRGLSVGVSIGRILYRELLTGLFVGASVAAAFLPLATWMWGDAAVALSASLALWAACSTATLVAMALPWIIERLGRDPAFGSGPLATVIQDLLSILIYFLMASAIVG